MSRSISFRRSPLLLAALPLTLAACGAASYEDAPAYEEYGAARPMQPGKSLSQGLANGPMDALDDGGGGEWDLEESKMRAKDDSASTVERSQADSKPEGATKTPPRLIRTGSVSVAVEHFGPFERNLRSWLEEQGGYISDTSLSHYEGEVSYANLTIRVPAEQFEALVGWTEERVKVEAVNVYTQDVTARWVDLEARLDNDRRAEARLQELLATSTASLSDVLEVERELARVRGEIESAEGQLRVLRDQVGYATLTLDVRVEQPWQPTVAPSFLDEAGDAFSGSIDLMGEVARGAAIAAVALSPWVGPPALFLAVVFLLVRSRVRRRRAGVMPAK